MNRTKFRMALCRKTGCNVQHDGWPCGTCFFSVFDKFNNSDWQALLLFRGDYKAGELDNLPKNYMDSIEKIYKEVTKC